MAIKKVNTDFHVDGIVQGTQVTATIVTGTSPLLISSTTLVTNLNSDLLDNQEGVYYLDYNNFTNIPFDNSVYGINALSTGLNTGGALSINTNNTKFDLEAGTGYVINNDTDPSNPVVTEVSWSGFTAQTVTSIAIQPVTYISINSSGVIIQEASIPNSTDRRLRIFIGVVVHSDNSIVNAINNLPTVAYDVGAQLQDLMNSMGFRSENGNVISPNGINLNFDKSAGIGFKPGSNFQNDSTTPHQVTMPSLTPVTFRYRNQDSSEGSDTTLIDPTTYDNSGVTTTISGDDNQATIQKVFIFPSNLIRIQRGQEIFSTLAEAIDNVGIEPFVIEANIAENGLFLGSIVVRKGALDLSNISDAKFIPAAIIAGSIGFQTTLQQAYDISITPEIVTDGTRGALTIKRGSALDTDTVLDIWNGSDVIVANITGEGKFLSQAYIVSGGTSSQILKADGTISDNVLSGLTDTELSATTHGYSLVYNSGTTKWEANEIVSFDGDADTLEGNSSSFFYPASNPNNYIDNSNVAFTNITNQFAERQRINNITSYTNEVLELTRGVQASGNDPSLPISYGFPYLAIGGREWFSGAKYTIGFGWDEGNKQAIEIGMETVDTAGNVQGDFVIATRTNPADSDISEKFRLKASGDAVISGSTTANSFVKIGGTSSEFLKADGTIDSNTYLTSETDSQTLTWTPATGDLDISNGNTVNLDGRYSLTGHTHTLSDLTDTELSGIIDGYALIYNSGTTKWEPTEIISGGGDVTKVGTPVNNQIGIWTGDGTLEGDGNLTFSSGSLRVGINNSISGTLNLYGSSGSAGGQINLYNGNTNDGVIDYYRIDAMGNFEIGIGPYEFFVYDPVADAVNIPRGVLNVGEEDDVKGVLNIYGNSSTSGGELRLFNGANGDTTDEYYYIRGANGSFSIGGNSTSNILTYFTSGEDVYTYGAWNSDQSIANIISTGNSSLITKGYGDAAYSSTGHTHTLSTLTDTELSATTDGYALIYNSGTTKWESSEIIAGGSATIIDDNIPTIVNGGTWYQPTDGAFSVGMDDIWVEISSTGPRGPQGISGTTGTDAVASSGSSTTTLDLSKLGGYYYDMASNNTATTYTTTNPIMGGFACVLINAVSEPTVTGATKIKGSDFIISTDMHMWVQFFGHVVQFFFLEL